MTSKKIPHWEENIHLEGDRDKVAIEAYKHLAFNSNGLTIDLDTKLKSSTKVSNFEQFQHDLLVLTKHLNEFTFGRSYLRNKDKHLNFFGVIEDGVNNNNLHIHLLATSVDETRRTFYEINNFTIKEWAKIIEIKSPSSQMSLVKPIANKEQFDARFGYACKRLTNARCRNGYYIMS